MELFMPLIMMAHMIGEDIEDEVIESAKKIVAGKKVDDAGENRDNILLAYLLDAERRQWWRVREIANTMKFVFEDDDFTPSWVGYALKRLRVVKEKKRKAHGFDVSLDWKKIEMKCHQLGIESEKEGG